MCPWYPLNKTWMNHTDDDAKLRSPNTSHTYPEFHLAPGSR